jgi:hypothetical protein
MISTKHVSLGETTTTRKHLSFQKLGKEVSQKLYNGMFLPNGMAQKKMISTKKVPLIATTTVKQIFFYFEN